jgi:hypothetical protein
LKPHESLDIQNINESQMTGVELHVHKFINIQLTKWVTRCQNINESNERSGTKFVNKHSINQMSH